MKYTRSFSANVGEDSTGNAGPDAIEQDIDTLYANDNELYNKINGFSLWVGPVANRGTNEKTIYFCY